MQSKLIYEFAVVRLVPKVEREEFINIGVIVLCRAKKFLKIKYFLDDRKLEVFSKSVDRALIEKYLCAWSDVCEGAPVGGKIGELEIRLRFRWLTASRSTIIQSSRVHAGLCDDPEILLDELFKFYVADPQ